MINAIQKKVTVKRLHKDKITAGGIHLQSEDNPNPQAEVLSIGEEVTSDVKIGDIVFLDWRYVFQLTFEGDNIYVTDISNILAVER